MDNKEIKIGEYIRDETGEIFRLTDKELEEEIDEIYWYGDGMCTGCYSNQVVKHSHNIIDLVEENDAIKFWYEKERICNVYKTSNGNLCVWNGFEDVPIKYIHIKSICTKEQFANAEYRLED